MSALILDAGDLEGLAGGAGGKATSLFRLKSIGLPVPDFFCVTRDAFVAFAALRRSELQVQLARLPAIPDTALPEISRSIQDLLSTTPFPEDLSRELTARLERFGHGFFSVRSSAMQEDSRAHSFAGLFKTSLFVPPGDVPAHVLRCWLSAFEPGVLGYCRRNSIDPLDLEVGVVVQQMVRSRVSGVMFTADPAGALSDVVVVAGLGLGEGVVADLVDTDTYRYDRATRRVRSEIRKKRSRIELDPEQGSGTRLAAVPEAEAGAPALTPAMLDELVALGLRAESAFGEYQDIEWAIDDSGALFVLQSRPITTIPAGEFTVLDNSNILEGYPGISLPLTFSALKNGYERNFSRMVAALGVPRSVIAQNRSVFRNMVAYVNGRIYYNLTNWYRIVNLNPTLGRRLTPAFDDMIGVRRDVRSADQPRGPMSSVRDVVVLSSCVLFRYLTLSQQMRAYRRRFRRIQDDVREMSIDSMSTHELIRALGRVTQAVFSTIYLPLINDMLLMLQMAMTKKLMGRFAVKNADDLLNALMCGEQGMESVQPVHSLVRLAELLEAQRVAADAPAAAVMERITTDRAFSHIRVAMDEHIALYGDRCPEELKFETDTFRENPLTLVAAALRHVGSGVRVASMEAHEARIRSEAEAELVRQLRGKPLRRLLLMQFVRKTRALLRNRESARLDRTRIIGIFRRFYRTLGRRLADEGTLASPADIYYLTEDEVSEIVHASSVFGDVQELQAVIERRRAMIDASRARQLPERLTFRGTGIRNPVPQTRTVSDPAASAGLSGTPCSPGVVDAEAVVIADPSTAPDVKGKIIVARTTDPGWVFLMIASSGLIVERGSLLSHTAIIGRELGIPTIVGVRDATSHIRTGQRIRMDASTGHIDAHPS